MQILALLLLTLSAVSVQCRHARRPVVHDDGSDGCALDFGVVGLKMPCRSADFGGFASTKIEHVRVFVADPIDACPDSSYDDMPVIAASESAVYIAHRGGCSFVDKIRQVKRWGGRYLVLVNSDNSLLRMQSPEWVDVDVVGVSVGHDDGARLIDYVQNMTLRPLSTLLAITHPLSSLRLCQNRIQSLLEINAPRTAADTFAHCAPDTALPLASEASVSPNEDLASFYSHVALLFRALSIRHSEIVRQVMLVASYFAVQYSTSPTAELHHHLGCASLVAGHFTLATTHFTQAIQETYDARGVAHCDAALATFLAGDYLASLEWFTKCQASSRPSPLDSPAMYDAPAASMHQMFADELTAADLACLALAATGSPSNATCCNSTFDADRGVTLHFQSPFVKFLYETSTLVGVFLDELGAFDASLVHFTHGLRLCGHASGLHVRVATSVPIVFDSDDAMHAFLAQFLLRVASLDMQGVSDDVALYNRPEHAGYLKWTITPPTMFVGYQGVDVAALQTAVANMYQRLYPSLARPPSSLPPLNVRHEKIKVGFVSSWFRTHSVGKLIQRVIQTIDRDQFQVVVFAATHFFPLDTTSDDAITRAIREAADRFVVLPASQEMAIHMILREAVDVLVYPEIGMDTWMYFLAHRRLAKVQCMFWGHPITTGLPTIDYFIASEYFFSDFFEGVAGAPQADLMYGGASYSEQLVLFSDLSTYFSAPRVAAPPDDASALSLRAMLHLPASGRMYLCPQTLMKIHVGFDAVIQGILAADRDGVFVLLYSRSQVLWKDRVHRRLGRTLGKLLSRRVVFVETLPYDAFMQLLSVADVMVDPFPFGGGVTTLDAFAVGLPVITLPSRQSVLQLAAGFYRYMSLSTNLIASNVDELVAYSVAIATNATLKLATQQAIHDRFRELFDYHQDAPHEWNTFLANVAVHAE